MKIIGQGVDMIEVDRIRKVIERHGDRLLKRVFTDREVAYVKTHRNPYERYAGRFVAKEAVLKAFGIGWRGQIAWTDMDIQNDVLGQPHVTLTGATAEHADRLGVTRILLSISHTADHAVATALAVAEE